MTEHEDLEKYQDGILDLTLLVKEWGARAIWEDLRLGNQEVYRELLYYALEEVDKMKGKR